MCGWCGAFWAGPLATFNTQHIPSSAHRQQRAWLEGPRPAAPAARLPPSQPPASAACPTSIASTGVHAAGLPASPGSEAPGTSDLRSLHAAAAISAAAARRASQQRAATHATLVGRPGASDEEGSADRDPPEALQVNSFLPSGATPATELNAIPTLSPPSTTAEASNFFLPGSAPLTATAEGNFVAGLPLPVPAASVPPLAPIGVGVPPVKRVEQFGVSAGRPPHDDSSRLSSGSWVECQLCGWQGHTDEEARTHFQVPSCLRLHTFVAATGMNTASSTGFWLPLEQWNVSRNQCPKLVGY